MIKHINQTPSIIKNEEIQLAGRKLTVSLTKDRTVELWKDFMPIFKAHSLQNDKFYSVNIYPGLDFFTDFRPDRSYIKWAAAPIEQYQEIPARFELLLLPAGNYAVFLYRGKANESEGFYRDIFNNWLPSSGFQLDDRPHFELMDRRYKNDSPDSEEEIWIPVKL